MTQWRAAGSGWRVASDRHDAIDATRPAMPSPRPPRDAVAATPLTSSQCAPLLARKSFPASSLHLARLIGSQHRAVHDLDPRRHLPSHPHVHVRLGRLDVEVDVVPETHQEIARLLELLRRRDVAPENDEGHVARDSWGFGTYRLDFCLLYTSPSPRDS